MAFLKRIKKKVEKTSGRRSGGLKKGRRTEEVNNGKLSSGGSTGFVSGFKIIKKEKERFAKQQERFAKGGGTWETYVGKLEASKLRFEWDGDPDTLQSSNFHNVRIGGNWKKVQCSQEMGDPCGGCKSKTGDVKRKSRYVLLKCINREIRVSKKDGKEYKDSITYIFVSSQTQIDTFIETAKNLREDNDVAFNEVDIKVKKVGKGSSTGYDLWPMMKTKRALNRSEKEKFNEFDPSICQFAPISKSEWEDILNEVAESDTDEEEEAGTHDWS